MKIISTLFSPNYFYGLLFLFNPAACSREVGEQSSPDIVQVQTIKIPCSRDFNQFSPDVEAIQLDNGYYLFVDKKTGRHCDGPKKKR